jgi:hypothetical protein
MKFRNRKKIAIQLYQIFQTELELQIFKYFHSKIEIFSSYLKIFGTGWDFYHPSSFITLNYQIIKKS